MKSCVSILFFVLATLFAVSCNSKVYFSNEMRTELSNKNVDITKLQFYIDKDVVLSREISSFDEKLTSGKVIFQNGRYFQNILLRSFTKGICTAVYQKRMYIAFEQGDNKNILFSIPKLNNVSNIYTLTNEGVFGNNSNLITYDGHQYQLSYKGTAPKLMINGQVIQNRKNDDRIMKGLKVS